MTRNYYLKLRFGFDKTKRPLVYEFLFKHLSRVLLALKQKTIQIELKRLEPLDRMHTHIDVSPKELAKAFNKFAKSHHLQKKASLALTKKRTSLKAKMNTKKLPKILIDYNILFDIFFTNTAIKSGKYLVDMMDAFNNTVLVQGKKEDLEKFKKHLRKKMPKTKAKLQLKR